MSTTEIDGLGHFDTVPSLDAANHAVFEQNMALRIQPKAPAPTRYYFVSEDGWQYQKAGHSHSASVSAEFVRERVRSALPKNDNMGGGGVKAVDRSTLDRWR